MPCAALSTLGHRPVGPHLLTESSRAKNRSSRRYVAYHRVERIPQFPNPPLPLTTATTRWRRGARSLHRRISTTYVESGSALPHQIQRASCPPLRTLPKQIGPVLRRAFENESWSAAIVSTSGPAREAQTLPMPLPSRRARLRTSRMWSASMIRAMADWTTSLPSHGFISRHVYQCQISRRVIYLMGRNILQACSQNCPIDEFSDRFCVRTEW